MVSMQQNAFFCVKYYKVFGSKPLLHNLKSKLRAFLLQILQTNTEDML